MEQHQAKRLVELRAAAYAEAKEVLLRAATEKRELTAEENEKVDRAHADIDRYTGQIETYEAQSKLDARFNEIDAETRDAAPGGALGGTIEKPDQGVDDEHRAAFVAYITGGSVASLSPEHRKALEARNAELRAQGVLTGAAGGYAAPPGWWSKITETMKFYGGMMQVGVEDITTGTGNPISWPTNDDTSNTGSWVGENADVGSATDLSFGAKSLNAHLLSSGILKASLSYLQDVEPQAAEGFITRKLGERLGRTLNTALTTGSGVGRPYGIINGLSTGKTTASATAITYAELIDLEHSVDIAYRNNARYMFHDLILAYLRKIVDSNGQPIYQVSYRVGEPSTINGRAFVVNNDMDSTVATTKKTIAFGDFRSCYVHRTVNMGNIRRLDERFAEYGQAGFISFSRHDGLVQDASAVKLLVQA